MNWTAWGLELDGVSGREAHLLVSAEAEGTEPRAPVMVNLLLDRSGSMKGAPLAAAVEAAQQFVELAGPEDFMGLVAFDGVAEQRVPLCAMDARGKRLMSEALSTVAPGRGTALHQAVELGARAVQRLLVPGRRPKLLLLTDGEPSVGQDSELAFETLGSKIAQNGVAVHALGLARHYVPEILAALTMPSGNAFEHVDGPEGLSEAMGAIFAHLFGEVASKTELRVTPRGLASLSCAHSYPTRAQEDSLLVNLGEVSRGLARRALLVGKLAQAGEWQATILGSSVQRGDQRHQKVQLERVARESPQGRAILGLGLELELVASETAAWLSLACKQLDRAHAQLEVAEAALRTLVGMGAEAIPARRHQERLGNLRLAVERGEGDIPLLIRRAKSANVGTHVSQVIPLGAHRERLKKN